MDQNAFRALLYQNGAAKADAAESSTSARNDASASLKSIASRNGYIDRAEARRRGIDADSLMKKGLDMKLLEEQRQQIRKAEQAKNKSEAQRQPQISDAELENALHDAIVAGVKSAPASGPRFQPMQTRQADSPDVIYVNGKRLRKKKAKIEQQPVRETKMAPMEQHAPTNTPQTDAGQTRGPAARTTAKPSFAVTVNADDDDIFGDAPEWTGVQLSDTESGSDNASDTEPVAQTTAESRNWFGTNEEAAQPPPQDETQPPQPDSPPDSPPHRLEGLSSSAMPSEVSRWLLEREEKRAIRDAERESQHGTRSRKRSRKGRGDIDSP
ncbi:hypothetical protein MCUN1_000632 [Malassezia cuniculi]|uniref:RED-like N-terminal domain-containing protein n=1 Tax=Malassezia cuniculi TaxID=948313 RepID=A0AAF0ESL2_9BASI|nr:hypothetical protein MCUN1_000632 [Malassezia cuniculi]